MDIIPAEYRFLVPLIAVPLALAIAIAGRALRWLQPHQEDAATKKDFPSATLIDSSGLLEVIDAQREMVKAQNRSADALEKIGAFLLDKHADEKDEKMRRLERENERLRGN